MWTRRDLVTSIAATSALGLVPGRADARVSGRVILIQREFEGEQRSAYLFLPTTLPRRSAAPLLLALHGGGGDAMTTAKTLGWADAVTKAGWYGLFPNLMAEDRDSDVEMLLFLLDEALAQIHADPARLYATGFSAGAGKTYRLAAQASDRFAAFAPVSGSIGDRTSDDWSPYTFDAEPISLLHIHGGADSTVPWQGTSTRVGMTEGLEHWASYLGAVEVSPPELPPCPPDIVGRQWVDDDGHEVVGLLDPDQGHSWPSWANQAIVAFFDRTPRR